MKKQLLLLACTQLFSFMLLAQTTPDWEKYIASDASLQVTGFANNGSRIVVKDSLFTSPVMTIAKVVRKINANGSFDWSILFKGKDIISGILVNQIMVDASGNGYIAGRVKGTVYVGADSLISSFNASANIFMAKINAAGEIVWKWQSSHTDINFAQDDEAFDAVLKGGNIYISGNAKGRGLVIGTDTFPQSSNSAINKLFVAKFDTAGNFIWSNLTKDGSAYSGGIDVDDAGNVYVGGYTTGNGNIQFGNSVSISTFDNCHFFTKFNSSGIAQLAKIYVIGRSSSEFKSLSVSGTGDVYVTGYNDFASDVNSITVRGNVSYIMKLDNAGVHQWTRLATANLKTNGVQNAKFAGGKLYVTATSLANMYLQSNTTDSISKNEKGMIAGAYLPDGTLDWSDQGTNGLVGSTALQMEITEDKSSVYFGGTYLQGEQFGSVTLPTPGANGAYHYGFMQLKVGVNTSVVEKTKAVEASVYPNPATDKLFVNVPDAEISIMDLQGKVVKQINNETSVDVSSLPQGIYFVKVLANGEVATAKFIKQ